MRKQVFSIPFFIIFWLVVCSALASDIYVQTPVTATTIQNACQTAYNNVATGPHNVIIPNGTYNNLGSITIDSTWDGQSGKEFILKAETLGEVTFSGNNRFVIAGDYWVLRGFKFTAFNSGSYAKNVTVQGDDVRITGCYFYDMGSLTDIIYGVYVEEYADDVEIDHNKFYSLNARSILIDNTSGDVALNPHIHHNLFKDITGQGVDNNNNITTIYLNGVLNTSSDHEMNAIIEYNLFDDNDGNLNEQFIVKCSNNTIRYNVFKNCRPLSLRLGDDNLVFNNWAFGESGYPSAFLAISGANHKIINNYIYGMQRVGTGPTKAIQINSADWSHERVENLLIEGNTVAYDHTNGWGIILFHTDDGDAPTGVVIRSNIFHSETSYIARDLTDGACSATWTDNIVYTTGTYYGGTGCGGSWPADSSNANQLTSAQFAAMWTERTNTEYSDLYVLDAASVAIGNGDYNSAFPTDFDGQPRPIQPDIGSDQYSATEPVISPVTEADVGPIQVQAPEGLEVTK